MKNMKELIFTILGCFLSLSFQAQTLSSDCNRPRGRDRLMKRVVPICEAGEGGTQQIWDFSGLELQDANYELQYVEQGADTVIGIEHRTMYYYRTSGDSLFCLGYENPTTLITYQKPELLLTFPLFQGRVMADYFDGAGNYCEQLNIRLRGKNSVVTDASGMLILPGGDTLQKVLRTYTHKRIHQRMTPQIIMPESLRENIVPFVLNRDSIDYLLTNDSIRLETEIWRWYADGYRYPVFETVKSTVYKFGNAHEHFATSFVYLPEEQYYDLPYDTDNQEKRDLTDNENWEREWKNKVNDKGSIKGDETFSYHFQLDDSGYLHIGYELRQAGGVVLILFDLQGRQLSTIHLANQAIGYYEEAISMSRYSQGEYLLRISAGDKMYGEKLYYSGK